MRTKTRVSEELCKRGIVFAMYRPGEESCEQKIKRTVQLKNCTNEKNCANEKPRKISYSQRIVRTKKNYADVRLLNRASKELYSLRIGLSKNRLGEKLCGQKPFFLIYQR